MSEQEDDFMDAEMDIREHLNRFAELCDQMDMDFSERIGDIVYEIERDQPD